MFILSYPGKLYKENSGENAVEQYGRQWFQWQSNLDLPCDISAKNKNLKEDWINKWMNKQISMCGNTFCFSSKNSKVKN